jgi:serine protease Do
MNFLKKYGIAITTVALVCFMALPVSNAQTKVLSNIMQLDSSGTYLGIHMEDVDGSNMSKYKLNSERGVIVRSVMKGSPAEAAGIKEDDVILEFAGTQVLSSMQLSRLVRETPVGRKADLVVSRDGKRTNLSATLEMRDSRSAENRFELVPQEPRGPGQRSFQFRIPEYPGPAGPGSRSTAGNKPRLGITIQPLSDQLGEFLGVPGKKGVLVSEIIEGSPSIGKLKSGDVITSFDGTAVDNPEELTRLIRNKSEGSVTLKVIRDKKEISVVVNLPSGDDKGFKL